MAWDTSPAKCYLRNVKTGDRLALQANPEELEESIEVFYNNLDVPGMSHSVLQYKNTGNYTVQFEAVFLADSKDTLNELREARNVLFAWGYAARGTTVQSTNPPRLLFVWPEMIAITCVLRSLSLKHKRFRRKGMSTHYIAKVKLEEIRDVRLLMEDVLTQGMQRSSSGSGPGGAADRGGFTLGSI